MVQNVAFCALLITPSDRQSGAVRLCATASRPLLLITTTTNYLTNSLCCIILFYCVLFFDLRVFSTNRGSEVHQQTLTVSYMLGVYSTNREANYIELPGVCLRNPLYTAIVCMLSVLCVCCAAISSTHKAGDTQGINVQDESILASEMAGHRMLCKSLAHGTPRFLQLVEHQTQKQCQVWYAYLWQ